MARARTDERRRRASLRSIDRAQPERGPSAQALRGRAVAKDEPGHRPGRLGGLQGFRDRLPRPLADGHGAARLGLEVARPVGVGVPGGDATIPSITGVFAGADFYEREAFDLFGIVFEGSKDLRRILLPEDWEGHPLRKDYRYPDFYHGIKV